MKQELLQVILIVSIVVVTMILLIGLVTYLIYRRNYKQHQKNFTDLQLNLKNGDRVEFSNGLFGTIVQVGPEYCDIKIKSGAVITVGRYAIIRK